MGQSTSNSFEFDTELENDPDEYIVLKSRQYREYKAECEKLQKADLQSILYDFVEIADYEADYLGYRFLGSYRIVNELYII
jgi:hypothetical protein